MDSSCGHHVVAIYCFIRLESGEFRDDLDLIIFPALFNVGSGRKVTFSFPCFKYKIGRFSAFAFQYPRALLHKYIKPPSGVTVNDLSHPP